MKLVEKTVRSESFRLPKRPIYIVGESMGACLALAVAARTQNIDLVLVLANPGKLIDYLYFISFFFFIIIIMAYTCW